MVGLGPYIVFCGTGLTQKRCTLVVFDAVDVPCPGTLHFSHIPDYV